VLFDSEPGLYENVAALFKSNFFSVIKQAVTENIVVKYWLTGVLPAFRDGINPLTAICIISNKPEYHGLCGLTDAEVRAITTAYLGPESTDEVMTVLQKWYNGYQFCHFDGQNGTAFESLYNQQFVFAHLEDIRARGHVQHSNHEPKDEIEATHIARVLDAMPKDGEMSFGDMWLRAVSGNLESDVRHQFPAIELRQRDLDPWVTKSLLYFFGVLSFTGPNGLKITNHTMIQLVRMNTYVVNPNDLTVSPVPKPIP
jgi:hypothetical protein